MTRGGLRPLDGRRARLPGPLDAAASLSQGVADPHRFHDLRHTFGTAMAAAGVPMRTLQEWMGHRDIGTTQRYADYAPNEREVEMVDRAFRGPGL